MKGEFILLATTIWIVVSGLIIASYPVPSNLEIADNIFCQESCIENYQCGVVINPNPIVINQNDLWFNLADPIQINPPIILPVPAPRPIAPPGQQCVTNLLSADPNYNVCLNKCLTT